eukprot:10617464-Alexandrium_andersonii.AAC.1
MPLAHVSSSAATTARPLTKPIAPTPGRKPPGQGGCTAAPRGSTRCRGAAGAVGAAGTGIALLQGRGGRCNVRPPLTQ